MIDLRKTLGCGSVLAVLAIAGLVACSSDETPTPSSPDAGTGTSTGTGSGNDSGTPSLGEPTWTNVYGKVISGTCTSCHGTTHETGLAMATKAVAYTNLVGVKANGEQCKDGNRTRIVADDADESLLWNKINGTQDCGDRMPLGGTKLSQAKIDLVKAWIEAGAKDD